MCYKICILFYRGVVNEGKIISYALKNKEMPKKAFYQTKVLF